MTLRCRQSLRIYVRRRSCGQGYKTWSSCVKSRVSLRERAKLLSETEHYELVSEAVMNPVLVRLHDVELLVCQQTCCVQATLQSSSS